MNEVSIFNHPTFGNIRTTGTSESPLFCLADVCKALDLRQGDVRQRLSEGVVTTQPLNTAGGVQQANFINEDGLYDVILDSRKPEARMFRKWVTSEVLPSIRKSGGYLATREDDTPELIMAKALYVAKATIDKQKAALAVARETIRAQSTKVAFANAMLASKNSCLVGELAKIISQNGYKIGQNRLFQWLRDNGYLGKCGEYYNIPNQRHIENGLFEVKRSTRSGSSGEIYNITTTKVTPKGQNYFINKFLQGIEKPALL